MKCALLVFVVLGSLMAVSFGQTTVGETSETFEAPGLFSIQSPHPSLKWRKETSQTKGDTTKHVFVCSTNQASTPLVLVVNETAFTEDFQRQTLVFDSYKAARIFAERSGFTVTKAKVPDMTDATKNRVMYSVVGRHQEQDVEMFIGGIVLFSKDRTYTLQAMSPSADSTKQMLSVVKTLKEIPPKTN